MPFITEYFEKDVAWYLLLCSIFLNGLGNSFVQGGLFGFASIFPPKYIAIMMTSQAISAVILNFTKIFCIIVLPPDDKKGADDMNIFYNSLIYISVGTLILIGCIIGFNVSNNLEFVRYYVAKAKMKDQIDIDENSALLENGTNNQSTFLDRTQGKYRHLTFVNSCYFR